MYFLEAIFPTAQKKSAPQQHMDFFTSISHGKHREFNEKLVEAYDRRLLEEA